MEKKKEAIKGGMTEGGKERRKEGRTIIATYLFNLPLEIVQK